MELFWLNWRRCLDGYRLARSNEVDLSGPDAVVLQVVQATTRATGDRSEDWLVVANSARWEETTPLRCGGLYRQLADCEPTTDGLLDFTNRHGFLLSRRRTTEDVKTGFLAIEIFRQMVALIDRREWSELGQFIAKGGRRHYGLPMWASETRVIYELAPSADRPTFSIKPSDLLSAIYVQMLLDVSGGSKLKKCLNPACPEWFRYGPGTGHRETAMYHSRACKDAHRSQIRKEEAST